MAYIDIRKTARTVLTTALNLNYLSIIILTDSFDTTKHVSKFIDEEVNSIPEWYRPTVKRSTIREKQFSNKTNIGLVNNIKHLQGRTINQVHYVGLEKNKDKILKTLHEMFPLVSEFGVSETFID